MGSIAKTEPREGRPSLSALLPPPPEAPQAAPAQGRPKGPASVHKREAGPARRPARALQELPQAPAHPLPGFSANGARQAGTGRAPRQPPQRPFSGPAPLRPRASGRARCYGRARSASQGRGFESRRWLRGPARSRNEALAGVNASRTSHRAARAGGESWFNGKL